MKKFLLILPLLILIVIISFYVINSESIEPVKYSNLSLEEYQKKIEQKEDFVMYIYKNTCGVCKEMKSQINSAIEESGAKIYALNADLEENVSIGFFEKYKLEKTPTIVYYENGLEKRRLVGYYTNNEIISFLHGS